MQSIGRLVFKATGVMSNRGLVKNSEKIGEKIVATMKQNSGKISNQEIQQAINDTVGVKAGNKIRVFENKEDALRFCKEDNICSEKEFEKTYNECLGFAVPRRYHRSSGLLIRDDLPEEMLKLLPPNMLPNTITHEIQHALSFSSGKIGLEKLIGRFSWGRKILDNRYAVLNNANHQEKYLTIQQLALEEKFGQNTKNLPEVIKELLYAKGILNPNDNKTNNILLHYLIGVYKDEARSYSVGFKISDFCSGQVTNQGKILADLFNDIVKALKQEKRQIQLNRIKSFFGFKPDGKRELDMIENARLREEARTLAKEAKMKEMDELAKNVKAEKVNSEDLPSNVLEALS